MFIIKRVYKDFSLNKLIYIKKINIDIYNTLRN